MEIQLIRRRYFTNKKIQTKFACYFMLAAALGSGISVFMFNFLGIRQLEVILFSMRFVTVDINEIMLRDTVYSLLVPLVFTIIAFLLITKLLFTQLNDPLDRIAVGLHRNRFGKLNSHINLRHNDAFIDVADQLNIMTDTLGHRLARILGHAYLLMEVSKSRPEDAAEALKVSERIDHHVSFLEKELAKFKR